MNTSSRKRRSFGFWAAVAIVAGGLSYPLSIGPAYFVGFIPTHQGGLGERAYRPLIWALQFGPPQLDQILGSYGELCRDNRLLIALLPVAYVLVLIPAAWLFRRGYIVPGTRAFRIYRACTLPLRAVCDFCLPPLVAAEVATTRRLEPQ